MQTVSTSFNNYATGSIRPLSWDLRISFAKTFDSSITFFTLDTSLLDSGDILAPTDSNPLQEWDFYEYLPYDDRVQMIEWSREIDFPYSVSAAIADFTLNNYDDYFTPNSASPIEQYILPKRPLRILSGFNNLNIPQFVGITEKMPVINHSDKVASFHALDFLSEMFNMPLNQTIAMRNVRTDEVLAKLFEQFGISPSQYVLARARNKIPFLFFEKGSNAGDAFRKLMEAEMGNLWLNEQGILTFEQRLMAIQTPVITFTENNTVNITTTSDEEIINTIRITSEIRDVQEFQPIWSKSESTGTSGLLVIPANGTLEVIADLENPSLDTVVDPTIGFASNVSWFTVKKATGENVTSNVSVTASDLLTNTFVMTFTNTNSFAVEIDEAEIWGEPAKIVDVINYELFEDASVAKYGEKVFEIDNNFIQSEDNCESLALTILDAYSEYAGVIEIEVKGNPALQLGDIIHVNALSFDDDYKIIKITNTLQDGQFRQTIKARHYTPQNWFVLNLSLLDGSDVLAP